MITTNSTTYAAFIMRAFSIGNKRAKANQTIREKLEINIA
jgi:hypothetical protein